MNFGYITIKGRDAVTQQMTANVTVVGSITTLGMIELICFFALIVRMGAVEFYCLTCIVLKLSGGTVSKHNKEIARSE